MSPRPRVIGVLVGDIYHKADMQTKYGAFFEALSKQVDLVDIHDASLKGIDRWVNAARSFHLDKHKWKEQFFKNEYAFKLRSARTTQYLNKQHGKYDYILQLGALFNANLGENPSKTLIYTDYTASLSASHYKGGRSPFTPKQLSIWLGLEKRAYTQSALIFVRAGFVKHSLTTEYHLPPEKVVEVGAGVNFAELPMPNITRQYDEPTALFIGYDFYRKGGDILLKAFAQLKSRLAKAKLIVLTNDQIPASLPISGVEFINPTWNRSFIQELYQRANLLVLPSRLETWGDVLLEAMAYELPCIGITGQSMENIIQHNITGLLVEPENPNELSQAMFELMSQPKLLISYGKLARKRIEEKFTWEKVIGQMIERINALQTAHTAVLSTRLSF
jgi:glycosyltransferase involved in cell wall biosynthesis